MKALRSVLLALVVQDVVLGLLAAALGGAGTARLFGIGAAAACGTLAIAEWFAAQTASFAAAHHLDRGDDANG
jgi:hypothetical protein